MLSIDIERPATRGGGILIAGIAAASVGSGLYLPLALVYFLALTEVPLAPLGVLLGAASAVAMPTPTLAGWLSDRLGAKPVVVAALVTQALSFALLMLVTEPVGIFVAAMFGAVGSRVYWSSIFTFISDYVDHARGRHRPDDWFAWANIARTVGIGTGGLVTGIVVADGSEAAYRGVVLVAAGCFALAALAIGAIVRVPRSEHDHRSGPGTLAVFTDRRFMALTGLNSIFALSTLMLAVSLPTFVLLAVEGPAWLTSSLLVGNAVLVLLLGGVIVRLVAPLRRTRVLMLAGIGWAAWSLGCVGVTLGTGPWVIALLVVATLLFTVSELLHAPASMAIAASIAPPSARGRYLAAFQYSWVLAEVVAPVLFATLFTASHALPFLVLAAVNAAAAVASVLLERRMPASSLRHEARTAG